MMPPEKVVLYAEDSPDDRFFMTEAWKEAGCDRRLVMVEDGDQAVEYLQDQKRPVPGLILLDIKMPRRTGLETLQWIRAAPRWKNIPVLLFSASAAPADVAGGYGGGANAFIVKPTTIKELVEAAAAIRVHWLHLAEFPPSV